MASLCEMCGNSAPFTCLDCNNSNYCSNTCLEGAQRKHRVLCRSFKDFGDQARPSGLHRRAIYFPVDELVPRFIWLPFERYFDEKTNDFYESAKVGDLLGQKTAHQYIHIKRNEVLDRDLDHTIDLIVQNFSLIDGSEINLSLKWMPDGLPQLPHQWRGPMIACRMKGVEMYPNESDDLDMTDFRHVIDELSTYMFDGSKEELQRLRGVQASLSVPAGGLPTEHPSTEDPIPQSPTTLDDLPDLSAPTTPGGFPDPSSFSHRDPKNTMSKVLATRINCPEDVAAGRPIFESVELAHDHPILKHCVSNLWMTEAMNLPLYQDYVYQDTEYNLEEQIPNQEATVLCAVSDIVYRVRWVGSNDILKPPGFSKEFRSIILVRIDHKPLYPEHVGALCEFVKRIIIPVLCREAGSFGVQHKITKKQVLGQVTDAEFARFYEDWAYVEQELALVHANPYQVTEHGDNLRRVPFVVEVDLPRAGIACSCSYLVLVGILLGIYRGMVLNLVWMILSVVKRVLAYIIWALFN